METREDVIRRLENAVKENGMSFVVNMVNSFHSCPGAGLRNMSDYLNSNGYY